jgi:hypothetical protein
MTKMKVRRFTPAERTSCFHKDNPQFEWAAWYGDQIVCITVTMQESIDFAVVQYNAFIEAMFSTIEPEARTM